MTFCSAASHCKNKDDCHRYLTPEDHSRAKAWAADLPYVPIAWADFSDSDCYEPTDE